MKKTSLLLTWSIMSLIILSGCTTASIQQSQSEETTSSYDANSRQSMIPASCQSFYDGCNQCNKLSDNNDAACTRMYCEVYTQPYCTDEISEEETVQIANPASVFCETQWWVSELLQDGDLSYCVLPSGERHEERQYFNNNNNNNTYTWLSVEQAQVLAQENGVPFRIVEQDWDFLPVTMDYRPGRINARIENNIVIGFDIE